MNPQSPLDDLSTRLTHAAEQKRRRAKAERDLQQVETALQNQTQRLEELGRLLKQEQLDVDRLDRLSLSNLFRTLLGSREEQAQTERQELLQAQIHYQNARRTVDTLNDDRAKLRSELAGFSGVDADYERLLDEKENLLRGASPSLARELLDLDGRLAQAKADLVEIEQAITAGNRVLQPLYQVISALESAEGWGTWDMLGGGMMSTMIKHNHIDDARFYIDEVQKNLTSFNRELSDVREQAAGLSIDIDGLDTFADYFFDGLVVDWLVQSSISKALERARKAEKAISGAVERLGRLRSETSRQVADLTARRAGLIETA